MEKEEGKNKLYKHTTGVLVCILLCILISISLRIFGVVLGKEFDVSNMKWDQIKGNRIALAGLSIGIVYLVCFILVTIYWILIWFKLKTLKGQAPVALLRILILFFGFCLLCGTILSTLVSKIFAHVQNPKLVGEIVKGCTLTSKIGLIVIFFVVRIKAKNA